MIVFTYIQFICYITYYFETGSHVTQTGHEFTVV